MCQDNNPLSNQLNSLLTFSLRNRTCYGSRARLSLYCDSPAVRKQLIEEINSKEQNLSLPSISNVPNLASLQSLDESSSPCRRLSNSYEKGYDSTLIMPPIEHDNKGSEFQEDMFFQKSPVGSPTLNGYKVIAFLTLALILILFNCGNCWPVSFPYPLTRIL